MVAFPDHGPAALGFRFFRLDPHRVEREIRGAGDLHARGESSPSSEQGFGLSPVKVVGILSAVGAVVVLDADAVEESEDGHNLSGKAGEHHRGRQDELMQCLRLSC